MEVYITIAVIATVIYAAYLVMAYFNVGSYAYRVFKFRHKGDDDGQA